MRTIKLIQKPKQPATINRKKRVAAYARVSTVHERQEHSLESQVDHYKRLIQANPEWEYQGIYIDDGVSGTQISGRTQFQELITKCEQGMIDIVLTKSISRFARNTVDLLETVRRLKELNIDVRFEKENIETISSTGEFLLTVLASFAQEESRSTSENLRWGVRKRYEKGISLHHRVYGYRWTGKKLVIEPTTAKVVRKIFRDYLKGKSMKRIADELNNRSILHFGKPFNDVAIHTILHNERYIGDTLLQKTYCVDFMSQPRKKNRGEHPMYYVEDTHPPIIKREIFEAVSREIDRRRELGVYNMPKVSRRCFTGKIICEKCGNNYIRTYKTPTNANWRCKSNRRDGIKGCRSIGINEEQLKILSNFMLGIDEFDEQAFYKEVDHISGDGEGSYTFHFRDGRQINRFWPSREKAYKAAIDRRRKTNDNGAHAWQR